VFENMCRRSDKKKLCMLIYKNVYECEEMFVRKGGILCAGDVFGE